MNVLLVNLGHRDLQALEDVPEWDLERGAVPRERIRSMGEKLCEEGAADFRRRFDFPILKGYLGFFADSGILVDQLVPFGSSQAGRSDEDTYPMAELLKSYPDSWCIRAKVFPKKVEGNPADFGQMFGAYQCLVRRVFREVEKSARTGTVYLGLTGGTPQMNMALLLESFKQASPAMEIEALYVPKGRPAQRTHIVRDLRRLALFHELSALAGRFHFAALAESLATLSANATQACVIHLARYGEARFNAAWREAIEEIDRARAETRDPQVLSRMDGWRRDVEELREGKTRVLWVRELAWQSEVVLDQGNLWSFLVRAGSFREAALRALAEACGVPFDPDGRHLAPEAMNDPDLVEGLQRSTLWDEYGPIDPRGELNHVLLQAIVECYLGGGKASRERKRLADLAPCLYALGGLVRLRNRVVHQGFGVDEGTILATLREGLERYPEARRCLPADGGSDLKSLVSALAEWASQMAEIELARPPEDSAYVALSDLLKTLLETWRDG